MRAGNIVAQFRSLDRNRRMCIICLARRGSWIVPSDICSRPGRIGSMELRNRIVMSPMGDDLCNPDGTVSDTQLAYAEARARGGVALVMLGSVAVAHPAGTSNKCQTGISDDRFVPGLRRLADVVHAHGSKIALQLTHAGKIGINDMIAGRPMFVPSVPKPGGLRSALHASDAGRGGESGRAIQLADVQDRAPPDDRRRHRARHRMVRRGDVAGAGSRASTASSCTPVMATCSTSSSPRPQTCAPTTTAARSRTVPACSPRRSRAIRDACRPRLSAVDPHERDTSSSTRARP